MWTSASIKVTSTFLQCTLRTTVSKAIVVIYIDYGVLGLLLLLL